MRLQFDFFLFLSHSTGKTVQKYFHSETLERSLAGKKSLWNCERSELVQFKPLLSRTIFPLMIGSYSQNYGFPPHYLDMWQKSRIYPTLSGHVAKITFLPLIIGTSNHNSIFTPLLSGHLIKWCFCPSLSGQDIIPPFWYIYPSLLGHLPPKLWMLAENEKMSAGIFSNLMMIFFLYSCSLLKYGNDSQFCYEKQKM